MFESSYRMFGSGRESLPDVRERSRVPSGCPGVVWRYSQMLVVRMPSRMSGSGRESLPDVPE